MRVLRLAVGSERGPGQNEADDHIRAAHKVSSIRASLICRRLCYATRVSREASSGLLALLQAGEGRAWRDQLMSDMAVMQKALAPKLDELPNPRAAPHVWEAWWSEWPGPWKHLVHLLDARLAAGGDRLISELLASDGDGTAPVLPAPPAAQVFPCGDCAKVFFSRPALKTHEARVHGSRRWSRRFAHPSGICPVCRWGFRNRPRLIHHLQHNAPRCAATLQGGSSTQPPQRPC